MFPLAGTSSCLPHPNMSTMSMPPEKEDPLSPTAKKRSLASFFNQGSLTSTSPMPKLTVELEIQSYLHWLVENG